MGFLHKLWDETLAGPAPESGLGKLRKYDSVSAPRSGTLVAADDQAPVVTRSITILRTHSSNLGNFPADSGSPSESPTTPGTPVSPGTPRNFRKLTRRKSSADALQRAEPRCPTGYDWMVITALDR